MSFCSPTSLGRKAIISNYVQSVILMSLPTRLHLTSEHLVGVLQGNITNIGPVQQKFLQFGNLPQPLKKISSSCFLAVAVKVAEGELSTLTDRIEEMNSAVVRQQRFQCLAPKILKNFISRAGAVMTVQVPLNEHY